MTASDEHLHEIEVRWHFLATAPIESGQLKCELTHTLTGSNDPLLAVDYDRVRSLLIPTDGPQPVPPGASGAAVKIASANLRVGDESRWYLCISCVEPALYDRFAMLVGDVLEAVRATPEVPASATLRTFAEWQELLRGDSKRASREALAGLFGELLFLDGVLSRSPNASVDCWVGPGGERHDFRQGSIAVEVKTTLSRNGRRASIHGIDQLEPQTEVGRLFLAWYRLEVAIGAGDTLGELLARVRSKALDHQAVTKIVQGLKLDLEHETAQVRFIQREHGLYAVTDAFPRLTRAQLAGRREMSGVGKVNYEIDLSSAGIAPMSADDADAIFLAIGEAR